MTTLPPKLVHGYGTTPHSLCNVACHIVACKGGGAVGQWPLTQHHHKCQQPRAATAMHRPRVPPCRGCWPKHLCAQEQSAAGAASVCLWVVRHGGGLLWGWGCASCTRGACRAGRKGHFLPQPDVVAQDCCSTAVQNHACVCVWWHSLCVLIMFFC